ncbi:MAG TPA: MBL fold metallo-hydrolase [Candidatus Paceibacterota bacterium]|nr:MBL fold metallo-hydrolase [Candidatus Paceibacterota bacterium]
MIITYYGGLCTKAQIGDVSVSFNPPLRSDGKTPRFSSSVALFSTKEKDQNFSQGGSGEVFIIDGPGEYEVGGIFIKGVLVEKEVGGKKKMNTIYSVLFDDINLCHLGAISSADIKPEVLEKLGTIDILFTPVTGGDLATPSVAGKLATAFQPHVVIPMYGTDKGEDNASLKQFLKEEGAEDLKPVDKLTIKKKDIESKEEDVVVLSPTS